MKKRLKMDPFILNNFNKKFIPYLMKIISFEQFNNLNIGKICWTTNQDLDKSVNLMKAHAVNYIYFSLTCMKKAEISSDMQYELTNLINYGIQLFEFIISYKFDYIKLMSNVSLEFPDNNYEKLLYNFLCFFSRILIIEPFSNLFNAFIFK